MSTPAGFYVDDEEKKDLEGYQSFLREQGLVKDDGASAPAPEAEPEAVVEEATTDDPVIEETVAAEEVATDEPVVAEEVAEGDPTPQAGETQEEADKRVLRYRFLHEDKELDLDEVLSDESKLADFRRTYQLGLNQDRLNDRERQEAIEKAQGEVHQNTLRWLDAQGFTVVAGDNGQPKMVPKDAQSRVTKPEAPKAPTVDLAAIRKRITETGDASAVVEALKHLESRVNSAADTKRVEELLDQRMKQTLAERDAQRQRADAMRTLEQKFDAALKERDGDFASMGTDKDFWVQQARTTALAEYSRQGSTHESVVSKVHVLADRLKAQADRATKPAPRKRKKAPAPVPSGAAPSAALDARKLDLDNDDDLATAMRALARKQGVAGA